MVLDRRVSRSQKSLRDPSRENEELLARGLPYITAVDDQTILLRDGDVMASFAVDGISASTSDETAVDEIAHALSSLVSQQIGLASQKWRVQGLNLDYLFKFHRTCIATS